MKFIKWFFYPFTDAIGPTNDTVTNAALSGMTLGAILAILLFIALILFG